MDEEENREGAIGYIELLATYINPEFMRQVLDQRETRGIFEGQGRVMRIGGQTWIEKNFEFDEKMRMLNYGEVVAPKEDNPEIPLARAELAKRGIKIPSVKEKLLAQGIDPEDIIWSAD